MLTQFSMHTPNDILMSPCKLFCAALNASPIIPAHNGTLSANRIDAHDPKLNVEARSQLHSWKGRLRGLFTLTRG
jgi:hypothetical protein